MILFSLQSLITLFFMVKYIFLCGNTNKKLWIFLLDILSWGSFKEYNIGIWRKDIYAHTFRFGLSSKCHKIVCNQFDKKKFKNKENDSYLNN